ncbi:MAG: hypothetical protein JST51_14410 [Armatimonadetes bacterium]|nr:hypothetical protein [Armatimonadota bacterium]
MAIRSSFERRLRRSLRLRSPFGNFDDEVLEVQGHFEDLCQEAKCQGKSSQEAELFAEQLLGDPKTVAGEISRKTPKAKGLRLQWMAIAAWLFFLFSPQFIGIKSYEIGSRWGNFVEFWQMMSPYAVPVTAILFAFGALRAKRFSFVALSVGLVLVPLGYVGFCKVVYGNLAKVDQSAKRHWDGMQRYRTVMRAEFFRCQNITMQLLGHADEEALVSLSESVRHRKTNGFWITGTAYGSYVYPTSFQKIHESNLPWIFFDTTNSIETAEAAWAKADQLKKVMPRMQASAKAHFKFFDSLSYEQSTLRGRTIWFTEASWQTFLLWLLASGGTLLVGQRLTQTIKRNRLAR